MPAGDPAAKAAERNGVRVKLMHMGCIIHATDLVIRCDSSLFIA
jgi:hypothetical protein